MSGTTASSKEAYKLTYFLQACSHLVSFVFITAKLVIESVSFGLVRIRGSATNFYLCVDKRGRLRARVSLESFLRPNKTQYITLFITLAFENMHQCR